RHYCCIGEVEQPQRAVTEADVVLAVGCRLHHDVRRRSPILPKAARLIQLNLEPEMIGMKYPVDAAIVADPKTGIRSLIQAIVADRSPLPLQRVEERRRRLIEGHARLLGQLAEWGKRGWGSHPMMSWQVVQEIEQVAGHDAVIVSELTTV